MHGNAIDILIGNTKNSPAPAFAAAPASPDRGFFDMLKRREDDLLASTSIGSPSREDRYAPPAYDPTADRGRDDYEDLRPSQDDLDATQAPAPRETDDAARESQRAEDDVAAQPTDSEETEAAAAPADDDVSETADTDRDAGEAPRDEDGERAGEQAADSDNPAEDGEAAAVAEETVAKPGETTQQNSQSVASAVNITGGRAQTAAATQGGEAEAGKPTPAMGGTGRRDSDRALPPRQ